MQCVSGSANSENTLVKIFSLASLFCDTLSVHWSATKVPFYWVTCCCCVEEWRKVATSWFIRASSGSQQASVEPSRNGSHANVESMPWHDRGVDRGAIWAICSTTMRQIPMPMLDVLTRGAILVAIYYGEVAMGGVTFASHSELSTLPLILSASKYSRYICAVCSTILGGC